MRRILVTRPQPDADLTATQLRIAGFQPVLLPVSETVPTGIALPQAKTVMYFDALAVTSANALRHCDPQQLAAFQHLKLYAVGSKTAGVARAMGFTDIYSGDGWGLHLGQYVARNAPSGQHFLYLTGRVRRPDFEAQLQTAGLELTAVETYNTQALAYDTCALQQVIRDGAPQIILLYSAVAAAQLVVLDQQVGGQLLNGADYILCFSQRIANELPQTAKLKIRITQRPDELAVLELLKAL